jgi:SAM-dependent methyltransferase
MPGLTSSVFRRDALACQGRLDCMTERKAPNPKQSRIALQRRSLTIYRCVKCNGDLNALRCENCGTLYGLSQNILDTLVDPSEEVIRELQGMALEQKLPASEWRQLKVWKVDRVPTLKERMEGSASEPGQYYQQISASFAQATASLPNLKLGRVLEIGAEADYYFLDWFYSRGAECHAANLFFQYLHPSDAAWAEKTLADMNRLPYRDGVFDLVLLSATSHHSPNLDITVREVARVLRQGGVALFLNDPIGGWLKRLGGPISHENRNALVHENEYPIWRYHIAFRRNNLRVKYLFSDFYDRKLAGVSTIHPQMRFARLATLASRLWRVPGVRRVAKKHLTWPSHLVFGFPLNAIAWKDQEIVEEGGSVANY